MHKSTGQHRSRGWLQHALFIATALVLAGCGGDDQAVDENVYVAEPAITCDPSVALFPVRGAHNTGYEAPFHYDWSCDAAYSNSDFGGTHKGVDIWAAEGTPVVASVAGQVITAKFDAGAGNVVKVRDACGWDHYSGHLQSIEPGIEVGGWVEANTVVGYVGNTGTRANGVVHLHHSLFPGGSGEAGAIDPFPYLYAVEQSVCGIP